MSVPRIEGNDSGSKRLAKTPAASDGYTGGLKKDEVKFGNSGSLAQEVESGFLERHRNWQPIPTPSAWDGMRGPARQYDPKSKSQKDRNLNTFGRIYPKPGMWPTPRANSAMAATMTAESAWAENRFPNLETVVGRTMWPTPTVQDSNKATKRWREDHQNNLTAAVFNPERMFPTPTTRDYKGGYKTESLTRKDGKSRAMDALPNAVLDGKGVETSTGGQLNPTWVEWLMGWPLGWTDLKPLAMDKYHLWLLKHGEY
jgi:hypothetical protein